MTSMIKWKRLVETAREPTRAHAGDAGFDLYASERTIVPARGFVDVPVGIAIEPPPFIWCRITGRSSTLRKHGILIIEGVIDQQYRGPLFFGAQSMRDDDFVVEVGDRLAQIIPQAIFGGTFVAAISLDETPRGERGFGSTGR